MQNKIKKFWNFVNINEEETELQIYSDIASAKSMDFWTGQAGDEVTPKDFLAELKEVKSNNICVRINSNGGDVFSANAIAVALEEEASRGKNVTCKIDGVCASAAVRVALACSKISIANGAYVMIHKPANVLWGYYNADDMRKLADTLDTIQQGIVDAYSARTGLPEKECSKLMDKETWFTAKEAVEKGFADEILFSDGTAEEETENSENEEVINRIQNAFYSSAVANKFNTLPKALKKAFENKNKVEEKEMEFKNYEDLKTAAPEILSNAENKAREDGAKAERERLQAIDALSGKIDGAFLNEAKYGQVKKTAEEVIVDAFKQDKMLSNGYMNAAKSDAEENEKVEGEADEKANGQDKDEEAKNLLINSAKNVRNGGKK